MARDDDYGASDPLAHAIAERDRDILSTVERSLKRGDVRLAFQPVVGAADGRPAFHEGLVRVLDETGRILPAAQVFPFVETMGLGRELDVAALRQGLDTLAARPALRLSINMSARSIGYARWARTLRRGLARDETVGERLILEISEASAMLLPDLVRAFMAEHQDKGLTFALDEFGAGQTCFRQLRDFYFDIVKVDPGFVSGCATDPDNQCILGALVTIGRQFDMFTVAVGVENAAEARFLAEAGFDCLQGFHFGAPQLRPSWLEERPQAPRRQRRGPRG
ncbi:EAL domain-containing protein [Jannaschia seohaensis]|uniref:EAL domain, c-di-GMP-specific phosphodiesterase class I (Or its enzymatically inactive variant) n=1 Tax=Jannaschia seohaensis TaxID=475081 RepID=A0A2Y9AVZ0_9RHOB|nr:EAL domain-containing protein [Jannaschia seohaensis]PWJ18162.1 EAL domain-containing protein (putative c-di-GMP-specific phosphodiesterase class I) [Jannaschia seohaensis]SSA46687.1 EAL domain, c-di-GMP-specific phosphodiesterase class I (or its enzymatically inactive variant) [Jannaschia seohaensis]